jgi:hypothetical protein
MQQDFAQDAPPQGAAAFPLRFLTEWRIDIHDDHRPRHGAVAGPRVPSASHKPRDGGVRGPLLIIVDPDPAEAVREMLAFLRGIGVVAPKTN